MVIYEFNYNKNEVLWSNLFICNSFMFKYDFAYYDHWTVPYYKFMFQQNYKDSWILEVPNQLLILIFKKA